MDTPNLSPEAAALLKTPVNNPQPVPDSPALRELFAIRYAMGSPAKTYATSNGTIYIRRIMLAEHCAKEGREGTWPEE